MARAKEEHPQAIAPFLTQHSADPAWPLRVGVGARGDAVHVCADCGTEIPDGLIVERDDHGRVVAYSASHDYAPDEPAMLSDGLGNAYMFRARAEVERTVHHRCGGTARG